MSKHKYIVGHGWVLVYQNDTSAYTPEQWANESLVILEENMVMAGLVHRDFEPIVASFGEKIHTRRPAEFVAKRKGPNDNVTKQDVNAAKVEVELNQHFHTSFIIKDEEWSKSFKDLVAEFLSPAVLSIGRAIDQVLLGQAVQFIGNVEGRLLGMTDTNAKRFVLDARETMNRNKAFPGGRNMMLTPDSETELLNLELFTGANQVGDDGTALREASLGRKLGFNHFMVQNATEVTVGNTTATGEIDNAAGYGVAITTITVDGFSATISNGTWFTVEGDDIPQQVLSTVGGGTPTSITFTPGLKRAVADDADVVTYTPGAVDNGGGYAADFATEITIDGFTVAPQLGQFISFGTQLDTYSIIEVNGLVGIVLDRPLEASVANDEAVNILPAGSYNFAFHRNALTLVSRPLAMPDTNLANAAVVNFNDLSIRVVMTYDGDAQGHLVTVDLLAGVEVLDTNLGAVMLG